MDVVYKALVIYFLFWAVLIISVAGVVICGIMTAVRKKNKQDYRNTYNLMWKFSIPLFFILAGYIMTFF